MNKYIVFFTVLIHIANISYSNAQIGINTDSPQQLFHIDAKSNTSGTANIEDDIVIDSNGRMGVGVLSPTARLHIETSSAFGLRLVDGTEGSNKMLYSKDSNGNLSWANQPASSATIYNVNNGRKDLPNATTTLLLAVPVTEPGNYLVFIRWWGLSTTTYAKGENISAYLFLKHAPTDAENDHGTTLDNVEHYLHYPKANAYFSFTTSLFGYASAGGFLKLYIHPSTPASPAGTFHWVIGSFNNNKIVNPSIIIFKV